MERTLSNRTFPFPSTMGARVISQPSQRNILGVVVLLLALTAFSVGYIKPIALEAQPAPVNPDGQRYQISSWAESYPMGGGGHHQHGSYIIDTKTGEVFSVTNEDKPKPIGFVKSVEKR
jgi:hypothetical protein